MISYTTGNILESNAEAIVNTVNCEGYMGKGIAYQFKLKFPENNKEYVKQCKNGSFKIGYILEFKESDKLIINFPTKDKWRNKSEYSYIQEGLNNLIQKLPNLCVHSVAFPPLGCGNGGLEWEMVKDILIKSLEPYQDFYDFIIYEPSANINIIKNKKKVPKLNASHLILMQLKLGLNKLTKTRLQKSAFLLNIFSAEEYFKFNAYNYGPYNHTIDVLSCDIKEYQDYYNYTTEQAFESAKIILVSDSVNKKLQKFDKPIQNAVNFINEIATENEVELVATILYIIQKKHNLYPELIPIEFEKWSAYKARKFSHDQIIKEIDFLREKGLLVNSLMGLEININLNNINNK